MLVDRGVSGSVPFVERTAGKLLLTKVRKGDAIVTAKLDRAFRSARDALVVVEELKDQGVGLRVLDLNGDVINNGMSKLFLTIAVAFAEVERDRIRERIRDAKRYLTSKLIFSGGKRPFGYDIVLDDDGETRHMVPNAAEMKAIERMQAMRAEGATYREIGELTGHGPKSVQRILERMVRAK
jgi:putative DNA-invertase from lambdoid prophage Rac